MTSGGRPAVVWGAAARYHQVGAGGRSGSSALARWFRDVMVPRRNVAQRLH
jgi:hypothetical protein